MRRGPAPRRRIPRIRAFHAHGCEVCSARYTDACATPLVNARCSLHRELHPRPRVIWDTDLDPIECCRKHSIRADVDTRERYALGGPGPWWICPLCARTSPYNPTTPGGNP